MPWVLKQLPEGDGFYYEWEGEYPIPEGELNPPPVPGQENLTDPIIGEPAQVRVGPSPLRIKENDPAQEVADILERNFSAPKPKLDIPPEMLEQPTTDGKMPEVTLPQPTFTEEFGGPFKDVPFAGDILPPKQRNMVQDIIAAPIHKAYRAATGRMSESQQRNFALSTGLGAVGGGPVMASLGALIGAGTAEAGDKPPTGPEALIPFERTTTLDTLGGPMNFNEKDLAMLGGAAALTLGFAFGPQTAQKFMAGAAPRIRSLLRMPPARVGPRIRPVGENAAPGTKAIDSAWDLVRAYDDINAPLRRVARKSGMDPVIAERVGNVFQIQTRNTTNALTEAAVSTGRMETPLYSFRVNTPLSELKIVETPEVQSYLHALDTIEEIKAISMQAKRLKQRAGPPVVRGMSLRDATQLKRDLETTNPEVIDVARAYRENLKAARRYAATGEYATLAPKVRFKGDEKNMAWLNAVRPTEVPFQGGRVTGQPVTRNSPIDELSTTMREMMRRRMENEAVGMYIDEILKTPYGRDLFKRVTEKELAANPNWRKNVVTIYRRGNAEHYTTSRLMADLLKMDPYYITGMAENALYGTKRLMEITTTGELAPWFALTSFLRNWQIGKTTAGKDRLSPTFMRSVAAIPQQLLPQMAREIAPRLDNASGGWLGRMFGQANVQSLAHRLAQQYERSMFAQLEAAGGGRGSIMQQQTQLNSRLTRALANKRIAQGNRMFDRAINGTTGALRSSLEGYRALLNAIHNAPSYSYARRNIGKAHITQIAREARHLTGDPRIGGQYYTGSRVGGGQPIRFEDASSRVSHMLGRAAQGYGIATEIGRTALPWYNATVQGMKRMGEAYMADPAEFTMRTWLYQIAPAAAIYNWNRSQGKDPNGVDYTDYMMRRRSEYSKLMNMYIAIPGRPAEDGIIFPRYHETSIAGHLAEVAMDHAFRSNLFNASDDFRRAADSYIDVLKPATPPMVNAVLGYAGMVAPQGVFGGDVYQRRVSPFDQTGGVPSNIDLYARAITPGLADITGEGYAAYTQTPKGFLTGLNNSFSAMLRRAIVKTPILRDIAGISAPISGNTGITEDVYKYRTAISQLDNYFKRNVRQRGLIGVRERRSGGEYTGEIDPGYKSQGGDYMAQSHLGDRPPMESGGLAQPKPNNPLFDMFIQMLHDRTQKDSPWQGTPDEWERGKKGQPTGGLGIPSLWYRHGLATQQIREIRRVNEGNMVTWQQQMRQRPEQMEYLRDKGVNPMNIKEVRNFYEKQRQDIQRVILFQYKAIEQEMSELAGRPIKIQDLVPYIKGRGQVEDEPNTLDEGGNE